MKHKTLTVKEIIMINRIMTVVSSVFTTIISVWLYGEMIKGDNITNILIITMISIGVPLIVTWFMTGIVNYLAIDQYNKQLIEESNEFAEAILHGKISNPETVGYLLRKIDEYSKSYEESDDDK